MKRHIFALVAAVLFVVLPAKDVIRASTSSYTVEDLGTIDGLVPTVTGMNASGQLSGYVTLPSGPRAVHFTGSGWKYLPGVASYSVAMAINDSGDGAGYHWAPEGFRAFRYTGSTGVGTTIDPLPGGSLAIGFAINATGEVVGYGNSSLGIRGWRAAVGLPTVMLPTLGGNQGIACGINDAGQVAGSATTATGHQHAYRVEPDNTAVTDIVPFNGPGGSGQGCAIDARGRVGGFTSTGDANRAFIFDSGAPVNVDTFAGSTQSTVAAIANGVSVGWFVANGAANAFVHTDQDGSANLNDLIAAGSGWHFGQAFAVNTSGQIAGNGTLNGVPRAFRLTPVAGDTTPPVISAVSATPSSIWPPNGKMVPVTVSVSATDDVDAAPQCSLTSVSSNGGGSDDAAVTGQFTASLRSEKNADDSLRVYSLHVKCSDKAGNTSAGVATVVVARDLDAVKAFPRARELQK